MTGVLFPVSGSVESAGCRFFLGWRGGRQRKVESVRGWMELWMLLRFCGGMERGTPEEGGIDPGLDAVVDAVEAL